MMDKVTKLTEILRRADELKFIPDDSTIQISGDITTSAAIENEGFIAEFVQKKVRVSAYQSSLAIFADMTDFESRVKENDFVGSILVINNERQAYFYENEKTYLGFSLVTNDFTIANAHYYFKLLTFLNEQEHK